MTAAAIAFAATMILGMAGLTTLVYRHRTTPQPPPDLELRIVGTHLTPPTVWDQTITELGNPTSTQWETPAFTWPDTPQPAEDEVIHARHRRDDNTTKPITKDQASKIIAKLANEH